MYGNDYGYRSDQQSMVNHLSRKAKYLESIFPLSAGDSILTLVAMMVLHYPL